ncbi:hypothetical protein HMN09_01279800 [Mycena chlorophos]|uniref:Trafficking protein particle complex II-specific subunit 65 IgD3 domain-containing protein n=1 Tax=Mycena chlorophos TaxID=658473 RepID=A0A8H6S224_MYCCL|nr:hypothetical protein HMN09_01279800 [Mycena chlorophos]
MSVLEQIFGASELDVIVPDTSLEYPPPAATADEWLTRSRDGSVERTQAFFDENLQALLLIRIDHATTSASKDPTQPPRELLTFLSHLQISLEATYIASIPAGPGGGYPETPGTARLLNPPRTASLQLPPNKLGKKSSHPSIFPPNTPNPTPASADTDRRYLKSEGTLLLASIWGQDTSENSAEAFSLVWSEDEGMWVAVYRLGLTVSFLRLAVGDPLLCLTVSVTLRDRPQSLSRPNHPLALYLASVEFQPLLSTTAPSSPTTPETNGTSDQHGDNGLSGLPEVNLLEGLGAGPSFPSASLALPTARLGSVSRLKLFTLQPLAPGSPVSTPTPTPMSRSGTATPSQAPATLRKSFRKTLPTVSGFRVRMRTVFVPAVLFPLDGTQSVDEEGDEDRLEAGTDERTVVLCVEVENSGESGRGAGFEVERVEVKVGGSEESEARAVLVSWGKEGLAGNGSVFPMRVAASEQYNLLYAVSFLRSPDEALAMGLVKDSGAKEMLQRSVTIGIHGKPYLSSSYDAPSTPTSPTSAYPTRTFCSKWNCLLDLSSQPPPEPVDDFTDGDVALQIPSVLPEPASPFPTSTRPDSFVSIRTDSPTLSPALPTPQTAGAAKRHTLPGGQAIVAARALGLKGTGKGYRASTSMLNPLNNSSRADLHPPRSSSFMSSNSSSSANSSTTSLNQLPTPTGGPPQLSVDPNYQPPIAMTPAYPAYPTRSALPATPPAVNAQSNTQGIFNGAPMGRSVEIRRERGMAGGSGTVLGVPPTPGPVIAVAGGSGFFGIGPSVSEPNGIREEDEYQQDYDHQPATPPNGAARSGEAIVVSTAVNGDESDQVHRIFPLDHFTLDVFVFNQSDWTRRFEVTCPTDRRRGRARKPGEKVPSPGIVPLDNRVRIGPLLPAACQSVRMEFLAVTPGVHSIDTLTITDVVSGYSLNLRSVMDIVVHEPGDV